jgi:hypothetical protein
MFITTGDGRWWWTWDENDPYDVSVVTIDRGFAVPRTGN